MNSALSACRRAICQGHVNFTLKSVRYSSACSFILKRTIQQNLLGKFQASSSSSRVSISSTSHRTFSTDRPSQKLTYEELVALVNSEDIQLFDVREPSELAQTGKIPGATNIPIGQLGQAFLLKPNEFHDMYGVKMPSKQDTDVVFYCLGGVRSAGALGMVNVVGFEGCRHFPGGWSEWAKRQKEE